MTQKSLSESLVSALGRIIDQEPKLEPGRAGPPPFTIAISREPGALGNAVARELGQRLGWPVYDQELLNVVAREMGSEVDLIQLLDEKPMSWLEQCVVNMVSEYNLNHDSYMVHLIAAVRSLGERGHCIIVGRGSNFILPATHTLHVRLVADLPDRLAVIEKRRGLSKKEAARWEEKTTQERRDFVRKHFNKDVADPHLYDLMLNTSRLTVPEAADVIIEALQRREARHSAKKQAHPPWKMTNDQ